MKSIANLLVSSILTVWIVAIAIFSVQNYTSVSLKFLGWESIKLPVGVVLTFSAGIGVIGGALAIPLFKPLNRQPNNTDFEDDFEEDFRENKQPNVSSASNFQQDKQSSASDGNDWLEKGSEDW